MLKIVSYFTFFRNVSENLFTLFQKRKLIRRNTISSFLTINNF